MSNNSVCTKASPAVSATQLSDKQDIFLPGCSNSIDKLGLVTARSAARTKAELFLQADAMQIVTISPPPNSFSLLAGSK
jgi:hypothetical protein